MNENFQMSTRVLTLFVNHSSAVKRALEYTRFPVWEGKLLSTVIEMRTLTSSIRVAESSRELHSVLQEFKGSLRTLTSSIRVAESSRELHSVLQEFKMSLRTSRSPLALDVPVGRCRYCL